MEPRNCNEQEIGFPSECPIGILRRGCLADGANLQSPRCDLTWPLIPTRCLLQWRCGGRARGGAAKNSWAGCTHRASYSYCTALGSVASRGHDAPSIPQPMPSKAKIVSVPPHHDPRTRDCCTITHSTPGPECESTLSMPAGSEDSLQPPIAYCLEH